MVGLNFCALALAFLETIFRESTYKHFPLGNALKGIPKGRVFKWAPLPHFNLKGGVKCKEKLLSMGFAHKIKGRIIFSMDLIKILN